MLSKASAFSMLIGHYLFQQSISCATTASIFARRHNTCSTTGPTFQKERNSFPIWTHSGLPTWCVAIDYKCESYKTTYAANNSRLLSVLPHDVAVAYPVLPRYASSQFHLNTDASEDVELLMRTYANAKFVSSNLHRKLGIVYTQKVQTYLSRHPTRGFVSYYAFTGSVMPPAAAFIRVSFNDAENSTLTPY
jgi:hypothetical protein